VEWVEKPYLLAFSVNFDVKRCTAATLRLRAADIAKLAGQAIVARTGKRYILA
jgi:hypothetical protein